LSYPVKNDADASLREIRVMLIFFNDRNEPLAGKLLSEALNVSPHSNHTVRVPLRHYVDSGQRVAVAVTAFKTDSDSWQGDHSQIIKAMKKLR
jgi:hypothetical protein